MQDAIRLWRALCIPARHWQPLLRLLITTFFAHTPADKGTHASMTGLLESAAADFATLLEQAVPPTALASLLREAVLAMHTLVDDGLLQIETGNAACQALVSKLLHEVMSVVGRPPS